MTARLLMLLVALTFAPMPEAAFVQYAADVIAEHYGVDPELVACMVQKESEWNPNAYRVNDWDDSAALGLCQFHLGSWEHLRRKMGLPEADRRLDPVESLLTMTWALAQGDIYSGWWATYPECAVERSTP